jgi:hypothetical protein
MRNPASQILTTDSSPAFDSPRTKAANLSQIYGHCVVRQAVPEREQAQKEEQSRNVYENKQNTDILPPESSDILVESTRIVGHFGTKRQESSDILHPIDRNRRTFWYQMTSNDGRFHSPAFPGSNLEIPASIFDPQPGEKPVGYIIAAMDFRSGQHHPVRQLTDCPS